jgi:plastocyanin
VICGFFNVQQSSLTVVKNAVGGDGLFAFGGTLGAFNLTTSGGTAQQRFDNLLTGSYVISEAVPAGWHLDSAVCDNGDNPATLTLTPGQHVTCTFANTRLSSITIVKETVNGNDTFEFVSQALGNFLLTTTGGQAQRAFGALVSGIYDVSELATLGWLAGSASCSDGSDPAQIDLAPGEAVTCTFTSQPVPTALPEEEEPVLNLNKMYLPLIDR